MNYKKTIVSILLIASLFTLSACKEKEVVKPVEKKEEPQKEHITSDKTEEVTTERKAR